MYEGEITGTLLTLEEVSRLLHIHPNTLRRWCQEGRIPAVRVSPRGDRRFRKEDIQAYLDKLNSVNGGGPVGNL
jgi:excisionase family DNA binding protein